MNKIQTGEWIDVRVYSRKQNMDLIVTAKIVKVDKKGVTVEYTNKLGEKESDYINNFNLQDAKIRIVNNELGDIIRPIVVHLKNKLQNFVSAGGKKS